MKLTFLFYHIRTLRFSSTKSLRDVYMYIKGVPHTRTCTCISVKDVTLWARPSPCRSLSSFVIVHISHRRVITKMDAHVRRARNNLCDVTSCCIPSLATSPAVSRVWRRYQLLFDRHVLYTANQSVELNNKFLIILDRNHIHVICTLQS